MDKAAPTLAAAVADVADDPDVIEALGALIVAASALWSDNDLPAELVAAPLWRSHSADEIMAYSVLLLAGVGGLDE